MEEFFRVVGIVCRYVMAALTCWWFFWFLALIGQPSGQSQELAGMAIGKAIVCGAATAFWFYRARKVKRAPNLVDSSAKPHRSVQGNIPPPTSSAEEAQAVPSALPATESHPPMIDQPPQSADPHIPPVVWIFCSVVFIVFAGIIMLVIYSNRDNVIKPTNPIDEALRAQKEGTTPVAACPAGIPAGVKIAPIEDLTPIEGTDGKASYDPADGQTESHYNAGQWFFSFKVSNFSSVYSPTMKFGGYCVTSLQIEVDLQSDDGKIWKASSRKALADTFLSPGYSLELERLKLSLPNHPKDGNLTTWRITNAWGFPVKSEGALKTSGTSNSKTEPDIKLVIPAAAAQRRLIEKSTPNYPPIAKAARVSGTVVLRATISKTGSIKELQVMSGPGMLKQAALDAVKAWKYKPYTVDNEPVEVETTVAVVFALSG